jgi:hypothetical protein
VLAQPLCSRVFACLPSRWRRLAGQCWSEWAAWAQANRSPERVQARRLFALDEVTGRAEQLAGTASTWRAPAEQCLHNHHLSRAAHQVRLMTTSKSHAPIALFVFKRPAHTLRTLQSLANNKEFEDSPLYVFADAARSDTEAREVNAVRKIVEEWPHPAKTLYCSDRNLGLSKSLSRGITLLCEKYGQTIVVEDDIQVSDQFLRYLNEGLQRYADIDRVKQISAHNFMNSDQAINSSYFLHLTTSWGWATWRRAWEDHRPSVSCARALLSNMGSRFAFDLGGVYPFSRMLKDQIDGKNDSWAIWWYLYVYCSNGLSLFPSSSLVCNTGFDGTGTHGGFSQEVYKPIKSTSIEMIFPDLVEESLKGRQDVRNILFRSRMGLRYLRDTKFRVLGR